MSEPVRIDKWLWAARIYKTRSLAKKMVESGKVLLDGQRCKASRMLDIGDTLSFKRGSDWWEVTIQGVSEQRRGAPEAQLLYSETEASQVKREKEAELRKLSQHYNPHPDTKPDKKQRRQLMRVKHGDSDS